MPAYTTITNGLVAVGAKPFATTVQALRDNPIAIAEGDALAPLVAAGWHPFNKTMNNGSETGLIWSTAANGPVAVITTPDFADGWDYGFWFERVTTSSGAATNFNINMFRETSAAYAGLAAILTNQISTTFITGFAEIPGTRLVRAGHFLNGLFMAGGNANALLNAVPGQPAATHATSQKILRCQFSYSAGNIQGAGAAIYMLRRRNVAT